MKVVILCGGLGTRLSEETVVRPKPMVTVGGKPILHHIMNHYGVFGYREFALTLGFKGEIIKDYFLNYYSLNNDCSVDLKTGETEYYSAIEENWKVDLIDTGLDTLTGGRLLRLQSHLKDSGTFMLTYGDGVANVNIEALIDFHKSHGRLATITAVRPPARFGTMLFDGEQVLEFCEKPQTGEGWINGGFFIFEPGIFDYLSNDRTILEAEPLENLAREGQLMAYKHDGFWQCMDTIRDRNLLESLWATGKPPWVVG